MKRNWMEFSQDDELWAKSLKPSYSSGTFLSRVEVTVNSYNKGPLKIKIARIKEDKTGAATFIALGRLTAEEATELVAVLNEALGFIRLPEQRRLDSRG